MRRIWWTIGLTSALAFGGVPGLGPPSARAQGYPYGGYYTPAPGNVYQGPGYYYYYYYPPAGYFYPAQGYFYAPGFRYPVLRYSYGPPAGYTRVPQYTYPAPWYGGRSRPAPRYDNRYRPNQGQQYWRRDRRQYSY